VKKDTQKNDVDPARNRKMYTKEVSAILTNWYNDNLEAQNNDDSNEQLGAKDLGKL
jgi:hypothetical protein